MQIGIIGLGRMGGNISRRLMKAGHRCVVFDTNTKHVRHWLGRVQQPPSRWLRW